MIFLVIGLGSMGKRRVRCLLALGYKNIIGLDPREDRRKETQEKYGIKTISNIKDVNWSEINRFVISTPPDEHLSYLKIALDKRIPSFIEASVLLDGLEEINTEAKKRNVFFAPSCTMLFHPAIKKIKEIIQSGKYGKFTNFSYHSGQYLPDWHLWENVKEFYVSNKKTGGCREIVPFELTWLVEVLGFPTGIKGYYSSTMDVGADIEDTYAICMKFKNGLGTMLVDVTSRYAIRNIVLNLEQGQIMWRWDEPVVNVFDANSKVWTSHKQEFVKAAEGYNENIPEQMYIDEVDLYINAANKKLKFPNNLDKDIAVIKFLLEVEKIN